MNRITINKNITGLKLNKMLEIVAQNSTMLSVTRYCNMNYNCSEALNTIEKAVRKHRLEYEENIDGFKDYLDRKYNTESKIDAYFENIYNINLRSIEDQKPLLIKESKKLEDLDDFIELDYTNDTPVTSGPEFEMAYFKIGDIFQQLKSMLPSLLKFPYKIIDKCYEDLTFYNDSRVIMAICSHENFAYLNLTDEEYKNIKDLGTI